MAMSPIFRLQRGTSLIEVMVTVVIVSLGLLGIAALFLTSQRFMDESYQRAEAINIARQLSERMISNPTNARLGATSAYNIGTAANSIAGSGSFTTSDTTDCASAICTPAQIAAFDLRAFDATLRGAARQTGTGANMTSAATLYNARGCVEFLGDATSTTNVPRFLITVAWRGREDTAAPDANNNCAKALYDTNDLQRRLITLIVVPMVQ